MLMGNGRKLPVSASIFALPFAETKTQVWQISQLLCLLICICLFGLWASVSSLLDSLSRVRVRADTVITLCICTCMSYETILLQWKVQERISK
jgi:hypothetical protein